MEKCKPVILIVDDNSHNLQVIAEIVEANGYVVVLALNGRQALEFVSVEKPDLILMDIMMPEMDGFEVCSILKNNVDSKDIPVIFLTAKTETEDIVKGFEAGGVDYVTKPFNAVELSMRIKNHLELKKSRDELAEHNIQQKKANEELKQANALIGMKNVQLREIMTRLEYASKTDSLTGLYNRRCMTEKIEEEVIRFKRNNRRFSLIMSDIDLFKKINDTYGHDCGDYILRQISTTLLAAVREMDSVGRWGGEEFLILLPETDIEGAELLAERIRKNLESQVFSYNKLQLSATMTFGVSAFSENDDMEKVIKRADNALYEGKANGRNCVVASK